MKDYFPEEFEAALRKALQAPYSITFSTNAKAKAFRVVLYNYRYSIRNSLFKDRTLDRAWYDDIMSLQFLIKDTTLTIQRKKHDYVKHLSN